MFSLSRSAGTGSSGEHFTAYDITICFSSSAVAGSNSKIGVTLGEVAFSEVVGLLLVIESRILPTFSWK